MTLRVLVDANVLFSRTLRDWLALIYLSPRGQLYTVHWTEDILAEVLYRLRRRHPDWNGQKTNAIRRRIAETFEGGRVEDFVVDGSFQGSDPDDRHVHAAALACAADIVLTGDDGFVGEGVDADLLPYEVLSPDAFFVLADDSAPEIVAEVTRDQTRYWYGRHGRAPLAQQLEAAGCPEFARRVQKHQSNLSL
ncbi:PIN domain-containing protein [Saccharomonospora iraqiensis]|uniref:PIN domain-containing protein n=1 Tax=Saccharomonospora iraqiensis TaxID=52698 RepID=UPI00047EDABF|nr:PIN domain-containing protein [Saccharomonospora iraqiensis]